MFSVEEIKPDENKESLKDERKEEEKDIGALYEKALGKPISPGSIITGTVIQIGADYIMIDIGRKIEGQAPIHEFIDDGGDINIDIGDQVDVLVESINTSKGLIKLSKEKAKHIKIWEEIIRAYHEHNILTGKVTSRIKGGLTVDIGVPAFLPGSQVDINPPTEAQLDALVGSEIELAVIKYNKRKNNVVVSHREVLEKQREEKKKQLLATLKEGDVLKGTVKNIMPYGVFTDIGGIDGLLHITDMSWGRLKHPSEKVKLGQEIEVEVIRFDSEAEKISLGLKQLTPYPWEGVEYRYPIGKKVRGRVTSITNYGVFVELEEGIEGLVHISEMSWTKKIRHPSSIVKEDQEVDVVVLDVNSKDKRISLGLKQALPNPWDLIMEHYPVGTVVEAKVKSVTEFGVFVSIDDEIDIDGLIHISDLSWDPKGGNLRDLYKKGDIVKAKVLNINPENEKFSLGIKQLSPDPWTLVAEEYPVGSMVKGRVTSLTEFGAFVEIKKGVEGMVHISEVSKNKINSPADVLQVGQEVEAVVLKVNPDQKKIGLSIKTLEELGSKKKIQEKYIDKVGTNLGALIKELQNKGEE
ncbi:MAG: 30S ribosomal protein S1 [Deltaproteobacteria bacterium]|nr:30S ribosomal protein S1 [Deltaproteobacteria bacterium]